jgi:hypothetical protein
MTATRSSHLALFLCLATAGAASAQDYARPGGYLGLAGTVGVENFSAGPLDFDPSLGFNALGGYRFHPPASAEAQFEWTSAFEASNSPIEIEGRVFTVNGRVHVLTGRIQPNLLAGIGFMNAEASAGGGSADATGFAARLGGGVEFYATEDLAIALDASYVFTTGDVDGLDYASFGWGLRYRF